MGTLAYYQQMSEHQALANWLNMDASIGFHFNYYDSNSNCFYRIRDDSISSNPKLFQEEEPLPRLPFKHDNTVNFQDLERISHDTTPVEQPASVDFSSGNDRDSPQWVSRSSSSSRRGLKYLAHILLRTLKRRRSSQQGDITELIEHILSQQNYEENSKEEKNIRRRIYDALNVMIAAGLLERETSEIRIKACPTVTTHQQIYEEKIKSIEGRIDKKRQLLNRLESKKNALQYWLDRNRNNPSNSHKYTKFAFPLIFVLQAEDEPIWMDYSSTEVVLKHHGLQFLSQTDLIQLVYEREESEKNFLMEDLTR